MLLVALLFFAGYYGVHAMPLDLSREICMICSSTLLGLCLFGVLFLLADFRGVRSRRVFALQLLLVGLSAGFSVMRSLLQGDVAEPSSRLLSPEVLIYGNIYAIIMLMYPLELLYPGRMTFGRYFKLFLPPLLTGLFYYGYIRLTGCQMTAVGSFQDMLANFPKFDVWFRFTIVIYPIWMFVVIMYQKRRYMSWYCKHHPAESSIDLGWLDYYLFGYFLILISYVIVISIHNAQSILMHNLCFLVFFSYSFYNIFRQEVAVLPKPIAEESSNGESASDAPQPDHNENEPADDRYRFTDKIPEYKLMLEQWMQTEKPYLNKNFKLLDVMQALPLNRSYLSRMFNEAYGETFFSFIMRYRIEESIRLLESRPDLTVAHIASDCGFSSASVFGRAFLKNVGVTPKEYRSRRNWRANPVI